MIREPVVLINALAVADEQDEAFLDGWQRARDYPSTQEEGRKAHDIARGSAPAF